MLDFGSECGIDMTDEELDLVETNQLVNALHRRSTCTVLMMNFILRDGHETMTAYYRGGQFNCLGLLQVGIQDLMIAHQQTRRPADGFTTD